MSVESNIDKADMWFRGEDKVLEFTVYQSDGETLQDITGWALSFDLCNSAFVSQINKTSGSGITITDPTNGVLQVAIDDVDTDSLEPASYRYELKRTDSGSESVLAHGFAVLQRACA